MPVRIYQPPKNAMQSGRAQSRRWVVEFEQEVPRHVEPLMGWTSGRDTKQQLRLRFDTREEAIAYCERNGLQYAIEVQHERAVRPKAYADNFAFQRPFPWTH